MIKTTRFLGEPRKSSPSNAITFVHLALSITAPLLFNVWANAQMPNSTPSTCENIYLTEARETYSKLFPETQPRTSEKVLGISLELTKDETLYLNEMLGSKPHKDWLSVPKTCKRALCSLTHFLKNEESAMRVLTLAKNSGYYYWLKSDPTPIEITPQTHIEIRHISRAVQKLPTKFQSLRGLKYIVRAPKGLIFHSNEFSNLGLSKRGATSGKRSFTGFIYLFDKGISNRSPAEIQSLTLTQIGAHVDMTLLESTGKRWSESRDYLKALGWTLSRGIKHSENGPIVFEKWLSTNSIASTPSQEFSEGFAVFLTNPQSLEQKSAALFQFMKSQVFQTAPVPVSLASANPADFPKILEGCFTSIRKITETRHGLEIEGQNGRKLLRGKAVSSLSDNLDLAQLECLPPQANLVLTAEACDANNGNKDTTQEYLPVLNALGSVIDSAEPSKLETIRGRCFKDGLFTKSCLLQEIKVPLVNESKSKSINSDLSKRLEISIFSPNQDQNLKWLLPFFPIKRFGHECLFSMIRKFRIENDSISYQLHLDPNYNKGLNNLKTCDSLDLNQVSTKTFQSDDPKKISEILSNAPTTPVVYETVFNTLLTAGKRCQTFYSKKVSRDCLSEELKTDLAPLEKFEPWIGPFYQKLITNYVE